MEDISMYKSKPWYKSRTIWLAIGQSFVAILVAFQTQYPEANVAGTLLFVKSIIDIMYRVDTKTPIN